MVVINWRVTTYNDITIPEGMGLIFQWNGPVPHSVVEMASRSSVDSCLFVGPQAALTGQVSYCVNLIISYLYVSNGSIYIRCTIIFTITWDFSIETVLGDTVSRWFIF